MLQKIGLEILLLLLLLENWPIAAQVKSYPYGLPIQTSLQELRQSIQADSNKAMVKLSDFIPGIHLDIKYAGTANIFYEQLYSRPHAFVRLPVAKALAAVQQDLREMGLALKIYDAYRPYSVTCRMFERLPDTIYMGLPRTGSKHNRGIALDLTLINLSTGKELAMPTPFDALVYAAHPEFSQLPERVIRNRETLKSIMRKHGFEVDPVEWWHYNYSAGKNFELMDIDPDLFEQLY
ncbi:M15 family metallopeptidase [Flavihumibacter cheonanensis]|uniref:M15 family metallopeptidase n=1 Tax=Flavihumibacter cheonanensis TaxID=1442385 RepID=UPI001EF82F6B|nr:M15 family metallopeptidase [Flavihumibacter cheonanensis]MCG7753335.1 M15 family metallopeptidase [Flavihumibacter cheonanensis]